MTEKLADVLAGLKHGIGAAVKTCNLLTIWERVVDERVRKQTEAVKIRNRVLYVNARSSTWAQELTFLKGEFISKFNSEAGADVISDNRFKAG